MRNLPTFFVVGTQKAGTTTLHDWLSLQPDISLPKIKETHFFRDNDKYNKGLDWYLDWFKDNLADPVVGEIDPDYMFFPEVPVRIKKNISAPKFIFIFRNPLDRAFSHYLMTVRRGYETLPFSEALAAEEIRLKNNNAHFALIHFSYLSRGQYSKQIFRYKTVFPESDFLFIKFDELFQAESGFETYKKICGFIGVKSDPAMAERSKRMNMASKPRSYFVRDLIYKNSLPKKIIGKFIPSEKIKLLIAQKIDNMNRAPLKEASENWRNTVPSEILAKVNEEIAKLEKLTGLTFDNWFYPV